MVRLVIKEMRQSRCQPLADGAHVAHGRIGEASGDWLAWSKLR